MEICIQGDFTIPSVRLGCHQGDSDIPSIRLGCHQGDSDIPSVRLECHQGDSHRRFIIRHTHIFLSKHTDTFMKSRKFMCYLKINKRNFHKENITKFNFWGCNLHQLDFLFNPVAVRLTKKKSPPRRCVKLNMYGDKYISFLIRGFSLHFNHFVRSVVIFFLNINLT